MRVLGKIRDLVRRKPLSDDDLRAREEARLVRDQRRTLKMSQRSEAGQWDSSGRGGRY
jgi:hypothetical protein